MTKKSLASLVMPALVISMLAACGEDGSGSGSDGGGDASSSGPGVTEDSITIGTSAPLTGLAAGNCKPTTDAEAAWFAKVNADGGVNGRTIDQKQVDDAYNATEALANARELAPDSLVFFGGCGSVQPAATQQVAGPEGIPYLFLNANPPDDLLEAENFRGIVPRQKSQAAGIVNYAYENHGAGSTYMVTSENADTALVDEVVKAAVDEQGGTIAGASKTAQAGGGDLTPIVLQIQQAKPDYLWLAIQPADAARLVEGLAQQNALPKKYIITAASGLTSAFVDPLGPILDDKVLAPQVTLGASDPAAADCIDAFEEYGDGLEANTASLLGCAFAQAMVTALDQAGDDLSRENILAVIDSWKDEEASQILPPLTFGPDQHIGPTSMPLATVKGGKITYVEGESLTLPAE